MCDKRQGYKIVRIRKVKTATAAQGCDIIRSSKGRKLKFKKKVINMKNNKSNIKSIKRALGISTAAMIIGLIGVMLVFVKEQRWDAVGCSILACNAAIFCGYYEELKKASEPQAE